MSLICKECNENWELVGRTYSRNNSIKVDYFCTNCKCKKKPMDISAQQILKKEQPFYEGEVEVKKKDPIDLRNILIVGDIHEPFCLDGYLEFCKEKYDEYNCTHTIFVGDIIDNHYASFHATDPDGLSAKDELDFAVSKIQKWSNIFPVADVCLGNHDLLILRKAYKEGVSTRWVKDFNEVLDVNWDFKPSFEYNNILFRHGLGMKASPKAGSEMMNVIQGHFHTEAYIHFRVGRGKKVFGAQCPCGIDREAYAMAYAKEFPKPAIGCMTLNDYGKTPIIHMCDL